MARGVKLGEFPLCFQISESSFPCTFRRKEVIMSLLTRGEASTLKCCSLCFYSSLKGSNQLLYDMYFSGAFLTTGDSCHNKTFVKQRNVQRFHHLCSLPQQIALISSLLLLHFWLSFPSSYSHPPTPSSSNLHASDATGTFMLMLQNYSQCCLASMEKPWTWRPMSA